MENILMWITIGIIAMCIIGYVIYQIIKIVKMSPEERKEKLITYLKGVVAFIERELGAGNGPVKLEQVEKYFEKNASWFLKTILMITGKDNLRDLIEMALKEIKEDFGGE
jgi:hypothetical protein